MRFGNLLIGFLLAIGVAYAHDASVAPMSAEGRPQTIVNWDVLGRSAAGFVDWARDQLGGLADQLHRPN